MSNYVQSQGVWFHKNTPEAVKQVLLDVMSRRALVRLWLGDTATGVAWAEENDVFGRIGRSTGSVKVPLLVKLNDDGGPQLLDHCIVRIDEVKRVPVPAAMQEDIGAKSMLAGTTRYKHPAFNAGVWEMAPSTEKGYHAEALRDGAVHARFKNLPAAAKFIAFMKGERYTLS